MNNNLKELLKNKKLTYDQLIGMRRGKQLADEYNYSSA